MPSNSDNYKMKETGISNPNCLGRKLIMSRKMQRISWRITPYPVINSGIVTGQASLES